VLRNDLNGSRPPSTYKLAFSGTWYDVWVHDSAAPPVAQRWPLGNSADPAAPAPCDVVKQAAGVSGIGGRVAIAQRAPLITVDLTRGTLPAGWSAGQQPGSVNVTKPGSLTTQFSVPTAGTYRASIGQSFWGTVTVSVDGAKVYSAWGQLNWSPYSNPMPPIVLAAGNHTLTVTYSQGWRPGEAFTPSTVGPVMPLDHRAGRAGGLRAGRPGDDAVRCARRLDRGHQRLSRGHPDRLRRRGISR